MSLAEVGARKATTAVTIYMAGINSDKGLPPSTPSRGGSTTGLATQFDPRWTATHGASKIYNQPQVLGE